MVGRRRTDGGRGAYRADEVATFRELYRSRDGRITVFEDGEGHITAVDSSRLAQTPSDDDGSAFAARQTSFDGD